MSRICFITTCMGRLAHLRETVPAAVRNKGHEFIVVDWSCPDGAGDWVEAHHPEVRVVRVPGEPFFHVGRARNRGAAEATAEWLCFFDADVLLAGEFARRMAPRLAPGGIYRSREYKSGKWGTHLVRREDFVRVEGYDEVMQGYGSEDDDLYIRYGLLGLQERRIPPALFRSIPHDTELSVRHYENRDMRHSNLSNLVYSRMKVDLMKITGRALGPEQRERMKKQIDRDLERQGIDAPLLRFRVAYAIARGPAGRKLYKSLVYNVKADGPQPGST